MCAIRSVLVFALGRCGGRLVGQYAVLVGQYAVQLRVHVIREFLRARPVVGHGGRQPQSGQQAQPVAEQHAHQRVEAQFGEVTVDSVCLRVSEHGGDLGADQLQQGGPAFGFGQRRQPIPPGPGGAVGLAAGRRAGRGSWPRRAQQSAQWRCDGCPGGECAW